MQTGCSPVELRPQLARSPAERSAWPRSPRRPEACRQAIQRRARKESNPRVSGLGNRLAAMASGSIASAGLHLPSWRNGFPSDAAPRTGIEPVSADRQSARDTSRVTRRSLPARSRTGTCRLGGGCSSIELREEGGRPTGIEPAPAGPHPAVQKPLHYGRHSRGGGNRTRLFLLPRQVACHSPSPRDPGAPSPNRTDLSASSARRSHQLSYRSDGRCSGTPAESLGRDWAVVPAVVPRAGVDPASPA